MYLIVVNTTFKLNNNDVVTRYRFENNIVIIE